jgi:hypothetical protein
MSLRLTDHHLATRGGQLPAVDETVMLDYVFAGNGTFARGRRPGMEACVPVVVAPVRGLRKVEPYVQWGFPKVPAEFLALIFNVSQTIARHEPREALFYLLFDQLDCKLWPAYAAKHILCANGWHLDFPAQKATAQRVEPVQQGVNSAEARALIEIHSHHHELAFFSEQDDIDEGSMSFRLYGVIGTIFTNPSIRMRVGLFGHFMEYPASEFFEIPEGVIDWGLTK